MANSEFKINLTTGPASSALTADAVRDAIEAVFAVVLSKPRRYLGSDLRREADIAMKMKAADDERAAMRAPTARRKAASRPHEGRSERAMPRSNGR